MKVQKTRLINISYSILDDDGTPLPAEQERQALMLMEGLKSDKVMGDRSHLNDAAAMRIAASVMSRFRLTLITE